VVGFNLEPSIDRETLLFRLPKNRIFLSWTLFVSMMLSEKWRLGVSCSVFLFATALLYMMPGSIAIKEAANMQCFVDGARLSRLLPRTALKAIDKQRTAAFAASGKEPCSVRPSEMIMMNQGGDKVMSKSIGQSPLQRLWEFASSSIAPSQSPGGDDARQGLVVRTGVRAAPTGPEEAKNRSPNKVRCIRIPSRKVWLDLYEVSPFS
jgi:hypothetical protein